MMRHFVLVLAACGSSPPATPTGPAAAFEPAPAAGDDIVARVNGQPVYASCVAAQHEPRERAVKTCIDFELMAQVAEKRGLATDDDVRAETRRALVSRVVAVGFEDAYSRPSDFGATWDRLANANRVLFDHEEMRAAAYVRVEVPKGAPPEVDAQAHALADQIATAAAGESGMLPQDLFDIANKIAAGRPLAEAAVPPRRVTSLDPGFGTALFAIKEIGRTAPAVRTRWGWDVVLYSDVSPPVHPSEAEFVAQMMPEVKRAFFYAWTDKIAHELGVKVEIVKANVPKLEALP